MTDPLAAIVVGGILMGAIALVGSATLLLREETLDRVVRPLVAFAAGSLLGGAFFHMLPAVAEKGLAPTTSAVGVISKGRSNTKASGREMIAEDAIIPVAVLIGATSFRWLRA